MLNGAIALTTPDINISLGDVQCVGGCGNELGDGASKYLLPAKCKFGGDVDTPAGDAKYDERDGEILPSGLLLWWIRVL